MGHIMKKIIIGIMLVSFCVVSGVSGCSTVAGFGRDIQKGGKAIERKAES